MKSLPGEPVANGAGLLLASGIEYVPAVVFRIEADTQIPAGETVDFVGFFAGLPSAAKRFKLETTRVAAPPVGPTTPTSSPR